MQYATSIVLVVCCSSSSSSSSTVRSAREQRLVVVQFAKSTMVLDALTLLVILSILLVTEPNNNIKWIYIYSCFSQGNRSVLRNITIEDRIKDVLVKDHASQALRCYPRTCSVALHSAAYSQRDGDLKWKS